MALLRKYSILMVLLVGVLACGVVSAPAAPTAAPQASPTTPPSDTPAPAATATVEATSTPAPTEAAPTDTPDLLSGNLPLAFNNLQGVSQYFNPVGQPVENWNGIPIMPQAIAGQEYKPGQLYSFKATATIAQAVSFYQSRLPKAGFTSFMPGAGTGSAGTGSNAIHNSFLYFTKGTQMLLIYIASYDNDSAHVSVVISTQ